MFKAISWGQFLGFVFVLLLLYYAYVALVYYRLELTGLFKGKGKAAGLAPAPPTASLVGRGSLLGKPAAAPAAAPPAVASPAPTPAETTKPAKTEEASQAEAPAEQAAAEAPAIEELPALDLPTTDEVENTVELVNHDATDVDIKSNFTEQTGATSLQDTDSGPETAPEDFEPSFSVGIAQLGNYLDRAAEGQITQEELVEQEPGLADTELLVAMFQASTKSAQRATSHLYAGVAEPALG